MGIHKRGKVPASNQEARKAGLGYTQKAAGDQLGVSVRTTTRQRLQVSYPDIVCKSEKETENLLKLIGSV